MPESILFPTGRLVWGNMKGRTTDGAGKPLLVKSGPNMGKPKTDFSFGVAIPKLPGQAHWASPPAGSPEIHHWGVKILQVGAAAFPNLYNTHPKFAWKIIDGDSTIPNENNKKPCDQTGYPGHWIVKFGSGFAPKVVNENGTVQHTEDDYIKTGYYVQVYGTITGNDEPTKPGVYINHNIVSFQGFGAEISNGPDAAAVGFGGAPLPAGASATPIGGMTTAQAAAGLPALPGATGGAPSLPALPGAAQVATGIPALPGLAVAAPTLPALPGIPVVPNPAILAAPVAAPHVPVLTLTAKALTASPGATIELFRQGNWTDQLLLEQGMAVWV